MLIADFILFIINDIKRFIDQPKLVGLSEEKSSDYKQEKGMTDSKSPSPWGKWFACLSSNKGWDSLQKDRPFIQASQAARWQDKMNLSPDRMKMSSDKANLSEDKRSL